MGATRETPMRFENKVRQAAETIKAADAFLLTAAAGMGVDSGLLDFRARKVSGWIFRRFCETFSGYRNRAR